MSRLAPSESGVGRGHIKKEHGVRVEGREGRKKGKKVTFIFCGILPSDGKKRSFHREQIIGVV